MRPIPPVQRVAEADDDLCAPVAQEGYHSAAGGPSQCSSALARVIGLDSAPLGTTAPAGGRFAFHHCAASASLQLRASTDASDCASSAALCGRSAGFFA